MENIVLTSLAVNFIEKHSYFRPLSHAELLDFLCRTTHIDSSGARTFMPEVEHDLVHFFRTFDDTLDTSLIEDTAGLIMKRLTDELSGITDLADLDVRFITCFVVDMQE